VSLSEPTVDLDAQSQVWIDTLAPTSAERDRTIRALRALLLRAARFEVARHRDLYERPGTSADHDLIQSAVDEALKAVLDRLDDFHGQSRFTTWACKFALLEAGVRLRRREWRGRKLSSRPERPIPGLTGPALAAAMAAIRSALTRHQRAVLVATAINGVPIDVLAARLDMTRGAVYQTIHDARQQLRAALTAQGFPVEIPERTYQ
jgi:RNA polymerase sigma-70 factor (ECF subfamily)